MTIASHPFGDMKPREVVPIDNPTDTCQPDVVVDVDDADRALHQLGRLTDQLESITSWAKDAKEKLQPRIDSARSELMFFMEHLRADTKQNSMKLPAGELSVRKRPSKVERDDDRLLALLGKAIEGPEFWKQSPKWSAIMGLLAAQEDGTFVVKEGGELVDEAVLQKIEPVEPLSLTAKDIHGRKL